MTLLTQLIFSGILENNYLEGSEEINRLFFFLSKPQLYLEKEMATHSSILAWRIPWMEEPGGLQSEGLQRYE